MRKKRGGKGFRNGSVLEKSKPCLAARIIAVLYIVFISIFAFDVLRGNGSMGTILLRFFIHLIPSIILVIILLVAWRCERFGGGLFIVASVIFTFFFETYQDAFSFVLVSVPPLAAGILFWVGAEKLR